MSKRKSYSVKEKLAIIARVKNGESKSSIKKQYGIPGGTLRGWLDDEAKLLSFVNRVEDEVGLGRKRARLGKHTTLDECLYLWYLQKRKEGALLSTSALKQQAEKLQQELHGTSQFKASDGWLWRWQKRHGVTRDSMLGAARPYQHEGAVPVVLQAEREILEGGFAEEQVYACGQATLCYRMLPSKQLDLPSDGQKQSSERVTILLCVNRTGNHKLRPLCVGKSRQPRCFKDVDYEALPVVYDSSNNITISSDMFVAWFHEQFVPSIEQYLQSIDMEPKALLLLDEHFDGELKSHDGQIRALFLPKNMTNALSYLPLEHGVIRAFKKAYRNELVLGLMSTSEESTSYLKALTLTEVAFKMGIVWARIPPAFIVHCWEKCFGDGNTKTQAEGVYEWIKVEDEDSLDYEAGSVTVSEPVEVPKLSEALECLGVVSKWLEAHDDGTDKLQQLESIKQLMLQQNSDDC